VKAGKRYGTLEQVFDDVWWTWGTVQVAPGLAFPRTMTIVRERDGLVVIHPVMMPPNEQAKIEALGPIKHIVRLGTGHGMDDPAYIARYKPTTWGQAGARLKDGATRDRELVTGGPSPLEGGTVIAFETSKNPECVIHVSRHGGIVFSCDSIQNWDDSPGTSAVMRPLSRLMGFTGRACLGPRWRKHSEPKDGENFKPTYDKIVALEFAHAIGGHGAPMIDTARDDLRAAIRASYRD
jgi:hypothetical protein